MSIEPNQRSAFDEALAEGDFVSVHLNVDITRGFIGSVVSTGSDVLRILAHQPTGNQFLGTCLGWDVVFPWASIAFIEHLPGKPVDCLCREGLS